MHSNTELSTALLTPKPHTPKLRTAPPLLDTPFRCNLEKAEHSDKMLGCFLSRLTALVLSQSALSSVGDWAACTYESNKNPNGPLLVFILSLLTGSTSFLNS